MYIYIYIYIYICIHPWLSGGQAAGAHGAQGAPVQRPGQRQRHRGSAAPDAGAARCGSRRGLTEGAIMEMGDV